jgi:hypothetical protein
MMDAGDRLLAERFAALADPLDDSDWLDVRRRAGDRRGRTWLVVAIAAALAALVVGSAFAYYADVIDFFGAEKAPRETVEFFESFATGVHSDFDPGGIPGETRRFEVTGLNGEQRTVFVAPTKTGGHCHFWERFSGGCVRAGMPLEFSYGRGLVTGSVNARDGASVELRYPDGSVVEPPITWISPPIERGFFFHMSTEQQAPTAIVVLDDDGEVVTEQQLAVGP